MPETVEVMNSRKLLGCSGDRMPPVEIHRAEVDGAFDGFCSGVIASFCRQVYPEHSIGILEILS